jgi:hypothetical protein
MTLIGDQLNIAPVSQMMREFVDQAQGLLREKGVAGQQIDITVKMSRRAIPGCKCRFGGRKSGDFRSNFSTDIAANSHDVSQSASG